MRTNNIKFLSIAVLALLTFSLAGCPNPGQPEGPTNGPDPNETAATVNGTAIKMEEVERAIKSQAQGQETKAFPA